MLDHLYACVLSLILVSKLAKLNEKWFFYNDFISIRTYATKPYVQTYAYTVWFASSEYFAAVFRIEGLLQNNISNHMFSFHFILDGFLNY